MVLILKVFGIFTIYWNNKIRLKNHTIEIILFKSRGGSHKQAVCKIHHHKLVKQPNSVINLCNSP